MVSNVEWQAANRYKWYLRVLSVMDIITGNWLGVDASFGFVEDTWIYQEICNGHIKGSLTKKIGLFREWYYLYVFVVKMQDPHWIQWLGWEVSKYSISELEMVL